MLHIFSSTSITLNLHNLIRSQAHVINMKIYDIFAHNYMNISSKIISRNETSIVVAESKLMGLFQKIGKNNGRHGENNQTHI